MVYEKDKDKFHALLQNKRNCLLDERSEREEAWKTVPEREPEEMAGSHRREKNKGLLTHAQERDDA